MSCIKEKVQLNSCLNVIEDQPIEAISRIRHNMAETFSFSHFTAHEFMH